MLSSSGGNWLEKRSRHWNLLSLKDDKEATNTFDHHTKLMVSLKRLNFRQWVFVSSNILLWKRFFKLIKLNSIVSTNFVFNRKKKHQSKRLLSQLKESLNGFSFGVNNNSDLAENEFVEFQGLILLIVARLHHPAKTANSYSCNWKEFDRQVQEEIDSVVAVVERRIHHKILTAIEIVVVLIVEIKVRSITGSSRHGLITVVRNPDQKFVKEFRRYSGYGGIYLDRFEYQSEYEWSDTM